MAAVEMLTAEDVRRILREELERLAGMLRGTTGTPPDELDTAAAAEHAGVTPDTVRDWIKRRGLPARRPPGVRDHRIARADLVAFLATPTKRRPPKERGPVNLSAEAEKILQRSRRG